MAIDTTNVSHRWRVFGISTLRHALVDRIFSMFTYKALCSVTILLVAAGSTQVVDERTAVPMGLVSGAVVGAILIAWKTSAAWSDLKARAKANADKIEDLEKKIDG